MNHFFTKILAHDLIAQDLYSLVFEWNKTQVEPQPGQFITVRVNSSTTPLLRRPFAFSDYDHKNNRASIIYQKVGPGTKIMANKVRGDQLDILGPLGNTFELSQAKKKYLLCAGGTGLGPMIFLTKTLQEKDREVTLIVGARDRNAIPESIFTSLPVSICTDNGSLGYQGTVIDYLTSLPQATINNTVIIGCGPQVMMQKCHEFAQKLHLSCQVSLEQIMACGVGACMGCVVKTNQNPGFARVCLEGPVFTSTDIVWT